MAALPLSALFQVALLFTKRCACKLAQDVSCRWPTPTAAARLKAGAAQHSTARLLRQVPCPWRGMARHGMPAVMGASCRVSTAATCGMLSRRRPTAYMQAGRRQDGCRQLQLSPEQLLHRGVGAAARCRRLKLQYTIPRSRPRPASWQPCIHSSTAASMHMGVGKQHDSVHICTWAHSPAPAMPSAMPCRDGRMHKHGASMDALHAACSMRCCVQPTRGSCGHGSTVRHVLSYMRRHAMSTAAAVTPAQPAVQHRE